jgi:hypothetical protein
MVGDDSNERKGVLDLHDTPEVEPRRSGELLRSGCLAALDPGERLSRIAQALTPR